jgi:hypothetical protein
MGEEDTRRHFHVKRETLIMKNKDQPSHLDRRPPALMDRLRTQRKPAFPPCRSREEEPV